MALDQTLPILLIFGLGLLLKRFRVLRKEHGPILSQLILNVALPATIMSSLWTMELSPRLLLLPACGLLTVLILLALGFCLAPLLGLQDTTRGAFLMAFPSLELGSVGYAYMLAAYGPNGLAQIALLDLGNGLFFFSVVAFLASFFGQSSERFHLLEALLKFVKSPVLWSYAAGLGFNLFHVHMPMLSNLLAPLGQALLLLILLLLAVEVEFKPSMLAMPLLGLYFKLSAGVIIGVGLSYVFGFTGMTRMAVVLGASLPVSLMTMVYAKENGLDARFLASMLSMALPISIGFGSLLLLLAH